MFVFYVFYLQINVFNIYAQNIIALNPTVKCWQLADLQRNIH